MGIQGGNAGPAFVVDVLRRLFAAAVEIVGNAAGLLAGERDAFSEGFFKWDAGAGIDGHMHRHHEGQVDVFHLGFDGGEDGVFGHGGLGLSVLVMSLYSPRLNVVARSSAAARG